MRKCRHTCSKIATVMEAARLVRHRVDTYISAIREAVKIDPDNLGGGCGIASSVLVAVLKEVNVRCDLVLGEFWRDLHFSEGTHCWVEVPCLNLILDVTATQFGVHSEVHVTSLHDKRYEAFYTNKRAEEDLSMWVGGQSPDDHKPELARMVDDVVAELYQSGFVELKKAA